MAKAGSVSLTDRREKPLIAVSLTEFSVHYEQADPELAEHAWQLAASRLVDHDVETETSTCPDWEQRLPTGGCKYLRRADLEIRTGIPSVPDGTFNR